MSESRWWPWRDEREQRVWQGGVILGSCGVMALDCPWWSWPIFAAFGFVCWWALTRYLEPLEWRWRQWARKVMR